MQAVALDARERSPASVLTTLEQEIVVFAMRCGAFAFSPYWDVAQT